MEQSAFDIFLPVHESSIVLAAHYAKNCNRTVVTPEDVRLGLMYAARNVLGRQIGTLYPEVYDDESTDEDEYEEETEDHEFTRYSGDDETCNKMNECFDTWDEWVPETPVERALKNSIDSVYVP